MIGMIPFRIAPVIWAVVALVAIFSLWKLADLIGDNREAKVRAEYETAIANARIEAEHQAVEAKAAREAASIPGALARLRQSWCTNCNETRR